MRVVVVTPPQPIVTYADAVARLRLDDDADEQTDVEAMIASATAQIDGPAGWLGRSLGLQVLEARFDAFSGDDIRLPCGPVVTLLSASWLAADGREVTGQVADLDAIDDRLWPDSGMYPWVGCSLKPEAIRVRYRAGYERVPAPIVDAILLMVGHAYRNRDADGDADMPRAVAALLSPYRLYR